MKISRSLVKAFLIFPLNVMGVIPVLLIWFSQPEAEFDLILNSFNSYSIFGVSELFSGNLSTFWNVLDGLEECFVTFYTL